MLYLLKSYRISCKRLLTLIAIYLFYPIVVSAQSDISQKNLLKLTNHSDSLTSQYPGEKAYLQFDKPYYALGDTIWFKAYLLNAPSLMLSAKSGLLHIDIGNDSGRLIKQYVFPVKNGVSWGNIALSDKDFTTGTCTLHAYTNWMRNFGDIFFCKTFYITGASENNWLVNTKISTSSINDKNLINAKLQFSNEDKTLFGNKPLQLKVTAGNKNLYKQKVQTDADGLIDVNFTLPERSSGISIIAENEERKAVIPVNIDRPEKIDLQFLPEGGDLVAGLPSHVSFKAIGEDGKGVNISGTITDHNNQQVASFQTSHNGMGSFYLTVQSGENYIAKVTLAGGTIKEYPLPMVKSSGSVLQVRNGMVSDSVEVSVAVTDDIVKANTSYFLIGKAREIVCYAAIINFKDVNYIRKRIAKSLFPSGITHFILMTTKYQSINGRLVFINHNDELYIKTNTDLTEYNPRDSIALHISVDDITGKPVSGNFSFAVTDDTQVKTDSLSDDNIISRMLLTSDIKGYIEKPGYYFSKSTEAWKALDNLMLTQGWVSYDLPSNIQYKAEHQFEVSGKVSNVFNKPVKGTRVILFSKSPSIVRDTVTDNEGRFIFNNLPRADTPIFIVKAVNRNGKSFNVNVTVDEVKPLAFAKSTMPGMMPWYVNSDSTLLNYARTNEQLQLQANNPTGQHTLKEVKIFGKKTVKGSQNLNGPGNADIVLDEKDLEAAGKKTWLQLLQENVRGFGQGMFILDGKSERVTQDIGLFYFVTDGNGDDVPSIIKDWYYVKGKPIKFIVDGTSVYQTYRPSGTAFNDITNYLNSHTAEDIKGIEVNMSTKYAMKYIPMEWAPIIHIGDVAFVEITTRSGHGPIIDNTPGMYLYKPLAVSWPKQFYKPKYLVTDTTKHLPDLRSTISWEPNIITDEDGKATLWFYAADKPSTYTITIEGIDFNGNLGYKRQKLNISKAIAAKSK
ncbi:carboxypeptidase-like regulatory domain-containing protein [Mucilaginibacter sp. McL0603]|uniref:carboxypeptidase-like regulatory domain-containing protein n=1 Tax=Mucilaginibacter sp. McL0603 TaxID=3415670 RepID=UPI003CE71818